MTSRELVKNALERKSPARAPRQLWTLPWAWQHEKEALDTILRDFTMDIGSVSGGDREKPPTQGDPYEIGE